MNKPTKDSRAKRKNANNNDLQDQVDEFHEEQIDPDKGKDPWWNQMSYWEQQRIMDEESEAEHHEGSDGWC